MKKTFKWLSALALMVIGAFVFSACGDDEEENATPAQLIGTWTVQSVQGSGPRVGTVITFYENGTISTGDGEGRFTYNENTGAFTVTMPEFSVSGTLKINGSTLTVTYTTSDGESGTMVLKKGGSTDDPDTPENPDQPDQPGGEVNVKEMVGEWEIAQTSDVNNHAETIVFNANGTGRMGDLTFSYTNRQENDRIKCEIKFSNGVFTYCKFVLVQQGNVLNGECQDNGGDWEMIVLQRPGYQVPSDGILGRWEITGPSQLNEMEDGPKVGMVLVFGENGELYIEGDPHIDEYRWDASSMQLYLSMVGQAGTLSVSGNMVTGCVAVWTLGNEMRVELKKL